MRQLVVALFFAIGAEVTLSASTLAEWTRVETAGENTFYIDYTSIRKDGNRRAVWEIQDLNQRSTKGVMSRRSRNEYDCNAEKNRILSISVHSESMAGGETLASGTASAPTWGDISPGSPFDRILKIVCAK